MIKHYRENHPFQNYGAIRRDPIDFLSTVRKECGDFVRINVPFSPFYLINDPDLIREALIEKSETLIIQGGVSRGLARLIGDGILTNRGDRWRESRRDLQPLFQQNAIAACAAVMRERVQESLDRWQSGFTGQSFPISREILALSCRIKCSTLFRHLPTFDEALEFADAIQTLQSDGMRRYLAGIDLAGWLPLPLNRRVNRARTTLVRLARQAVAHGASQPPDEILSILFAGTESPATTLCWALQLLEDHPAWRDRLLEPGSRDDPSAPTDDGDVLAQVLSETIRLYPAGWAFERCAAQELTLGGERIRKGSRLLFSPFLLHRNPRFWREPEKFDPARFTQAFTAPAGVPKYAYLPFGAGPRSCIGSRMAWLEMRITLTMILARCRWKIAGPPAGAPLTPDGSFKLRLNHPLSVRLDFPAR